MKKLFEPGMIGTMKIRNRIVMPAMQTRGADEEGFVTERLIDYYAERAKGGVGLIIVQQSFAWPAAKLDRGIALWDDRYIKGLSALAQAANSHGAKIAIQMGGRGTRQDKGLEPVAPSAVATSWGEAIPREITREEINFFIDAYAEAAFRVKKAGFNALEIHGSHGHLISQFLSPYTNRRTDEYGGSVENRSRFAVNIVTRLRRKLGPEFPILFRLNGDDLLEGGITPDDAVEQAKLLVKAGVNALHVSASCHETIDHHIPVYLFPPGNLLHLAAPIKRAVTVPVITVGKIGDPVFAEKILTEEKADFVAMGRALIADPELPIKAKEGRLDDIRRCLYCGNCQTWDLRPRLKARGTSCTVNPAVLRERTFAVIPSKNPKNIMVVGGGLAGMEAARTLAQRGHHVSLYERDGHLGGQWAIAAWPAYKTDYQTLIPYLVREMEKAGMKVYLHTHVNGEVIKTVKPDVIIIATGAKPKELDIEFTSTARPKIIQANDILEGKGEPGKRVVVIGGRYLGMEVAGNLAKEGRHVSLVEALDLGCRMQRGLRYALMSRLAEYGVYIYPCSPAMRITSTGVDIAYNGIMLHLKADTVVLAVGVKSENSLFTALKSQGLNVYAIGDCAEVGDAMEAVNAGAEIARMI